MTDYELHHRIADALDGLNDGRDVRALTEPIQIDQTDDFRFVVSSASSDRTYQVDTRLGRCSCPDHEQNQNHCKHLRAATFVSGQRVVPDDARRIGEVAHDLIDGNDDIDGLNLELSLDASNVDGKPRFESDIRATASQQGAATAADGGQLDTATASENGSVSDSESETEICGAETRDGTPCQWDRDECPHHDDRDRQQTTATTAENTNESTNTGTPAAVTAAEAVAADGSSSPAIGDAVSQALEAADDSATVIIVVGS